MLAVGLLVAAVRLEGATPAWAVPAALGAGAALAGWLAAAAPNEGGRPPAYRSVEVVVALGLLGVAALRLPGELGAARLAGLAAAFALVALVTGARARSAVAGLLGAGAGVVAVLAAATWLLGAGAGTYRWLLTACAVALVLVALWLRAGWPRLAILLIDGAGGCVLAIAATHLIGVSTSGGLATVDAAWAWEALLLACGCGLVAFGAVDREPTPAGLGIAVLASFVVLAGSWGDGLLVWPAALVALGGGVLLAGLRPARPLPPEPPGPAADAEVRPLR